MYLKIQQNYAALVAVRTDHALRREENKVKFLEGRFLDEKFPFLHQKKTEHEVQKSGHHRTVIARQQFCWKWISFTRFPNTVKVNIHEHWTRVTRFNPLWVSGSYLTRVLHTARISNVDVVLCGEPSICLALHEFSVTQVDRAPARCLGGYRFESCREFRFFLCPTLVTCW